MDREGGAGRALDLVRRPVLLLFVAVALIAGATLILRSDEPETRTDSAPPVSASRWLETSCGLPLRLLERVERGTVQGRSADISYVPAYPHAFGSFAVSTHSGPWDYLQRVPLLFYGPGYIEPLGDLSLDRPVTLADLAPTLGALLGTELPGERAGIPITEILDEDRPAAPPRLVLLVVWDGAGWNVLNRWPGAWPFLKSLMAEGTSVQDVTVGSSPSVTPSIHSTMGTGTFPSQHGVIDIPIRNGRRVTDSFQDKSPKFLEIPTLADVVDAEADNRAKVAMVAERGWHLGMMGHGAYLTGADKDIAVMSQGGRGKLITNQLYYRLPRYVRSVPGLEEDIRTVDVADGKADGTWMGHQIPKVHRAGSATPVWTLYQRRLIESLITNEGFGRDDIPDLFFTNAKEIDLIGHVYNLINPEMRSVLRHADDALEALVSFLDETVGERRWVLALTADHGSGPAARSIGAWPINMPQLQVDLAARFGVRVTKLFQAQRPTGMWFDPATMKRKGIDLGAMADFLLDYTIKDNVEPTQVVPTKYATRFEEKLFAAAFPTSALPDVMVCARERAA